jgi:hypothetical protein
MDESQIEQQMVANGFAESRRTKKVVEFVSLTNKKVVYFERNVGLPSSAKMIVHPDESISSFSVIPGVEPEAAGSVHHHSNMTAFPKKMNKGENMIPYGKPLRIVGVAAIQRFAVAFHSL